MSRNKSGAMELSGTFLIILTLSVFALIFGLIFLVRAWNNANQVKNIISGDSEHLIESSLAAGSKGELYPTTIFSSKRNFVNLGIKNLYNVTTQFNVTVWITNPTISVKDEVVLPTPSFSLKANETRIISISFKHRKISYPFIAVINVQAKVNNKWYDYYTNSVKVYK